MFANRNTRLNNNIINRHPQQFQDYNMNMYNNNINLPNNNIIIPNKNNMIIPNNNNMNMNKNIKNTNVRKGLNLNLKKTNVKGNMNMNNMNNNMNRNMTSNNNNDPNNIILKALSIIRSEFIKKDEKIKSLELKVEELEKRINAIQNSGNQLNNNNQNMILNNNYVNNPNQIPLKEKQHKIGKNFTFSEKYSEEINNMEIPGEPNIYNLPNKKEGMNNNINRINNMGVNYGTNSDNQFNVISKNENDNKANINKKERENSVNSHTSGNIFGITKIELKSYLKDVKSKLDKESFKTFISNVRLLNNSKGNNNNNIDRESVMENVRILFGEKFKNLYEQFKDIIGFNN